MTKEEIIQADIYKQFPETDGKIKIARERRIFVEVGYESFDKIFRYLKDNKDFIILCTITGLDEGTTFGIIYHLSREDGIVINIKTRIPKEKPDLKSINVIFPSSDIYERELNDLLGINVTGLPEGKRYPLPDDWPQGEFPLRKEWKVKTPDIKEEK